MKKMMLWEITIVAIIFLAGGCTTVPDKVESVKWVSVGTLVSVGPAMESTRSASRVGSAVIGDTKLTRTRVETTEGVYLVAEKIAIAETGIPVTVGYDSSDKYPDAPSYLALGGERYRIVR